ncbi:MAG: peptidoglycan-binding protein [Eubacteriales bacterium]
MTDNELLQETPVLATGVLKITVTSSIGLIPIENATVIISPAKTPDDILYQVLTNESGQTTELALLAPPVSYSQNPEEPRPYAEYDILVQASGYDVMLVEGTQVFTDSTALQTISLMPLELEADVEESIYIPDHTLYGTYPSKLPEDEVKPLEESGEIVLNRVVIPEYIIVHDGLPNDALAKNYYIPYKDYIKNVVSNEIYSTWSESTIYANVLAIQSFTLNRVYTEWYRAKGYDFTITSSTAFDQKWVYGRNIYENIDRIVDSIFNNYLSRPGVIQPIFTSYCDGQRVTCKGLSQWGSKYLGDQSYSAIEIIRYYYGNDMYINTTEQISGVPASWPGYTLSVGSYGTEVATIQRQINRIAENFPAIPSLPIDSIYGSLTANSVRKFQEIFNLPQTGTVDFATWYAISNIYVGVTQISEPS